MSREGGGYVICTEAGTRMQYSNKYGNNSIYVDGNGCFYQKGNEEPKPIGSGKAVFG